MVELAPGRSVTAGKSVRRNRPLTSFLASSLQAELKNANALKTTQNRAITRYRMILTPGDDASDPVVNTQLRRLRKMAGATDGLLFFITHREINTNPRH